MCRVELGHGTRASQQAVWVATFQLGEAILMVLIFFFATFRNKKPDESKSENDDLDNKLIGVLIYGIIQFPLAIILFIGNQKERTRLLKMWVIVTVICNIVRIAVISIFAASAVQPIQWIVPFCMYGMFWLSLTRVGCLRMDEIKMIAEASDPVERPVTQDQAV